MHRKKVCSNLKAVGDLEIVEGCAKLPAEAAALTEEPQCETWE